MSLTLTRKDDRFPVRAWSVAQNDGTVLDEIMPLSGSTWSCAFGGGACSFTVDLNLTLRDRTSWDWDAIEYVRDLVDPGRRSVILTQGDACLGEWWLTQLEPQGATQVQLTGVGWEQYPSNRAILQRYKWPLSKDQMQAAKTLLTDAFSGSAPDLTIPNPTNSGVDVEKDDRVDAYSTDYGQALDQICDTDNGLEWMIVPTVTWSAGRPVGVTRTVQWGFPELARSTSLVAVRPAAGERGGNVASWGNPLDMSRLITQAVVTGRGSGKKLVHGSYTDAALVAAGYPPVIRLFSEPTIKKSATASRRAKRRVSAARAALKVPNGVDLLVAESAAWPQVGDLITAAIEPTPADPDGFSGHLRAGEVSWTVTAGAVSVVTVKGVEQ